MTKISVRTMDFFDRQVTRLIFSYISLSVMLKRNKLLQRKF